MSNERESTDKHNRHRSKKRRIVLIAVILIVFAVILSIFLIAGGSVFGDKASKSDTAAGTDADSDVNSAENEDIDDTDTTDSQTNEAESSAPAAELEIETQDSAPYEHWLAAAVISGISMYYPDFDSVSYYGYDTTDLSQQDVSQGIYVTFVSSAEQVCIYAFPLQEERTESGTVDVYSEVIGYAAFNTVSVSDIPSDWPELTIDNINELITQSVRIMLYEH